MVRRYLLVAMLLLFVVADVGCCRHRCWMQQRRQYRIHTAPAPACDCAPSFYPPPAHMPPAGVPGGLGAAGLGAPSKMPSMPAVTEQLPVPQPGPIPSL